MDRPWRIEFEGALYHILSRGNQGQDIFLSDVDRHLFLDTLGEMADPSQRGRRRRNSLLWLHLWRLGSTAPSTFATLGFK